MLLALKVVDASLHLPPFSHIKGGIKVTSQGKGKMAAIKLPIFAGMVPSVDPYLLADQNAAYCENSFLYSGALVGLPAKLPLHTMVNPLATLAFRVPTDDTDPSYVYDGYWKEFTDRQTDFIKAPTSGDSWKRYYWTSPSEGPKYNTRDRIIAGQPAWLLGLPQPGAVSVVAAGGVSTTLVSRAYTTTLVTEYGEEGPASTPFLINGKIDDNYTVTIAAVSALDMGTNRNVKKIRLYRTITSAAGVADYFLVTEVNALTTTQVYVDNMSDATLSSKPILESTSWAAPPALQGFITMPNGIVAGYLNNELWFSEAYRPHAWPPAYALSLEHAIVGLGIVGQTLVICTTGNPATASGVNPSSITTTKLAPFEPCTNKGSIMSTEAGVFYASPNGLILVNSGGAENITKQYISRDKWNEVVNYGKIIAARFGSAYYAMGASTQQVFQEDAFQNNMIQLKGDPGAVDGFLLDPANSNVGFSFIQEAEEVLTLTNDMLSGEIIMVKGGKVHWIDQRPGHGSEVYKWRSKIYQTPELVNFAAFKVYLYENPMRDYTLPPNYDINQVYNPNTQNAVVRIYADGKLLLTHEIRESGELHRMPTGFKAAFWQIELEGMVKVKNFQMATSVKELASV